SAKQQHNEAIILPDWALTGLPLARQRNRWLERFEFVLNLPYWLGQRWEVNSFRTFKKISDLRVTVLDVPQWVLQQNFGKTFNPIRLTYEQALPIIDRLNKTHHEFLRRFRAGESWKETEYWE